MKVSIVIPCYNGEATVAEAVESALSQTHRDCEIVVVDDGSTDNSLKVLEQFAGRISLVTGPNQGGSAARNRGVAKASGEFIQFLDADDLLMPGKVAACLDAVRDLPETAIAVTDWIMHPVDPDKPASRVSFPADREDILTATLTNGLAISAPLHPREALLAIGGFRENLRCCQEKDLHLRLVATGHRFHRVPIEGVDIRRMPGSVSADNLKVLRQRYDVYRNLAGMLADGSSDRGWQRTLSGALTRDAFDLCNSCLFPDARPFLVLAQKLDPETVGLAGLTAPLPRALARLIGPARGARLYSWLKQGQKLLRGAAGRNPDTRQ